MPLTQKYNRKTLLIVLLLSAIFWAVILKNAPSEFLDIGGDSAQYIIVAESIAHGKGLAMANVPGEPLCSHYPPVFPLLLSPIIYFLGRNFYIMHLLIAWLGYLSLFAIYRIFKEYSSAAFSMLITSLFALSWVFISYSSHYILSEIPYLFFSSLTLLFLIKYSQMKKMLGKEGAIFLSCLLLGYFCRYIGITLFLGILPILFLNKGYKKLAVVSSIFLAAFLAWGIFSKSGSSFFASSHAKAFFFINNYNPGQGTILENPLFFIFRFTEGVNYYSETLASHIFPYIYYRFGFLKDLLAILTISLVFLGLWLQLRKDKKCVFHYYFIAYFLLISLSNHAVFGEGSRYILPILPFVFFYFFTTLKRISDIFSKKIFYYAFSLFIIFSLPFIPFKKPVFSSLPSPLKNFVLLHSWIKEKVSYKKIILSRKPTITYFYTTNKSLGYPFSANPDEIFNFAKENNASYIIIDEFSKETYYYLIPFVKKYSDKLKLIQNIGKTGILEIKY